MCLSGPYDPDAITILKYSLLQTKMCSMVTIIAQLCLIFVILATLYKIAPDLIM